jgi:hypothetical protein
LVVAGILIASLSILGLALRSALDSSGFGAVLFGAGLAAANTLSAHALLCWSRDRPLRSFLIAVLGGMAGRMAVVLGFVLIALMAWGLPTLPLVASLMGYFAVFQGLELFNLHTAHRPLEAR